MDKTGEVREDEVVTGEVVVDRLDVEQLEHALTVELSGHAVETHVEPTCTGTSLPS